MLWIPERSSAKNEAIKAIEEWQYVALQFGYVSLFVTAFPIAPLMAFFANCIGIQVEGAARLNIFQRTKPQGAEDIGTWQTVFTIIAVMAVITNAGLAFFTMGVFSDPSWDGWRVWLFLSYQYVIFGLIYAFMAAVPRTVDVETPSARSSLSTRSSTWQSTTTTTTMSRPTAVTAIATSPTCQMMRRRAKKKKPAASTRCCQAWLPVLGKDRRRGGPGG